VGVGSLNTKDAVSYATSGPMIRSVGIRKDLRFFRAETYASYWFLSLTSFLGKRGDSYDRFLIRVREMYESVNIVFQLLSNLASTPDLQLGGQQAHGAVNSFTFFDFVDQIKKLKLRKLSKYTSMESLIQHFKSYSEGQSIPKGFTYNAVEAPKGEFGVTLISDGTSKPYRCKIRTPAFHHMHIMSRMAQGHYLADLVTVLGSQDIVFGDVDR